MTFRVRFVGGGSRICLRENRGSNPRARRFLHLERRRMCLRIHKNRTVRVRCISCYGAAVDFEEGFLTQITHFVYRKRSHWRPFGLWRYTTCASAHISPRNRPLVAASLWPESCICSSCIVHWSAFNIYTPRLSQSHTSHRYVPWKYRWCRLRRHKSTLPCLFYGILCYAQLLSYDYFMIVDQI